MMELREEYGIAASPNRIWEALRDPRILREALPGCESVERISEVEWSAQLQVQLAGSARDLQVRFHLREIDPPRRCEILAEAVSQGGKILGRIDVDLAAIPTGTQLAYRADLQAVDALVHADPATLQAETRAAFHSFLTRLADLVEERARTERGRVLVAEDIGESASIEHFESGITDTVETALPLAATAASGERAALPPTLWVSALTLLVALILFIFAR